MIVFGTLLIVAILAVAIGLGLLLPAYVSYADAIRKRALADDKPSQRLQAQSGDTTVAVPTSTSKIREIVDDVRPH